MPIGVRDVPEAQDEYDPYVVGVYKLLVSGASEGEIADHLYRVDLGGSTEPIGSNRGALLPAARSLRRISVSP